jgi:O-antigen/teichoic acid export membrane protein
MTSFQNAFMYSAFGQYSIHILNFVTVIVLARIMTPAEIGVFAVAGTVSMLATELRSMGVVQYLIREKELDEHKTRVALGVTIVVSWSLCALLIVFAPQIADFYGEKALETILWILSATFFIGPFTSVPVALWQRRMDFKSQFVQKVSGGLFHSAGSILFVLWGYSYYGLAYAAVLGLIVELLFAVILQPNGTVWRPSFAWISDLVKFGFYTSFSNVFSRLTGSIPDLVIGRLGTMADVGIFSRGLGVILFISKFILSAIVPVILPHFSEIHRSGKSVADAYLKATSLLIIFSWPVFAVVSAASYPMVRTLFGDQWDMAVPIASILSLWAILVSTHVFSTQALIVTGKERTVFVIGLIVLGIKLGGVILAAPYGLEAIAWAIVAATVIELVIKNLAVHFATGLSIARLISSFLPGLVIAIACWSVTTLIDWIMPFRESTPWISLFSVLVVIACLWLVMVRLVSREAWTIVTGLLSKLSGRSKYLDQQV